MGCASSSTTDQATSSSTNPNETHTAEDSKQLLQRLINSNTISFNPHMILLGDSVLDNIVWLNDKSARMDICAQLNKDLQNINKNWQATNLAADGNTIVSVLASLQPPKEMKNGMIQQTKLNVPKRLRKTNLQAFLASDDNLKYLSESKTESKNNDSNMNDNSKKQKPIVVLSAGGNDVLGYLQIVTTNISKLQKSGDLSKCVINEMEKNGFFANYEKIIKIILENKCDIIMVFVYEPHNSFFKHHGKHISGNILNRKELIIIFDYAMNKLFEIGEKYNLAIIDMSRTGNPFNDSHYNKSSSIEGCEVMGQFITDLVIYTLYDFEWNDNINESNDKKRESKVYFGQSDDGKGMITVANTKETRSEYKQQLFSNNTK